MYDNRRKGEQDQPVPLDLRMRRILLPVFDRSVSKHCHNKIFHQFEPPKARKNTLHTGHNLDLGNSVAVTQDNADLGRSGTLLGQLANLVDNLLGSGLEPRWGVAAVRDSGG